MNETFGDIGETFSDITVTKCDMAVGVLTVIRVINGMGMIRERACGIGGR